MIRIITDSTADFLPEVAQELGVFVVPLKVIFGDDEYLDGVDLTNAQFNKKLDAAEKLPTTSQPAPEAFLKEFQAAADAGDEVICLTIASKLSGTYQSANIAKDILGYDKINVVDSRTANVGLQILVRLAKSMADSGKTVAEILPVLEEVADRIVFYAIIDDLNYLAKGGRLSTSSAVMGKLLGIKPMIVVSQGEIEVYGKAKGSKAAYGKVAKTAVDMDEKYGYALAYSPSLEECQGFIDFIYDKLGSENNVFTSPVGAAIATHTGTGAVGMAFVTK